MTEDVTKKDNTRDERGRWLKGIPAPPGAGRPVSSRQKISERLLQDLAVVWEEHDKTVLERLARDEPGKLATIAYGLLPRDLFVRVVPKSGHQCYVRSLGISSALASRTACR